MDILLDFYVLQLSINPNWEYLSAIVKIGTCLSLVSTNTYDLDSCLFVILEEHNNFCVHTCII